jgi:ABC-type glutathione transport system ATPase component
MMDDYREFLHWRERRNTPERINNDDPLQVTAAASVESVVPPYIAVQMEPVVSAHTPPPFLSKNSGLGHSQKALDEEACKDAKYLKLSEGRDVAPVTFAWRNVTLKVPIKEGGFMGLFQHKTGKEKFILDQVSGFIEPGQVLFIMGPSGAGKSSMLDALADRVKAPVTGVQFLNGQLKVCCFRVL